MQDRQIIALLDPGAAGLEPQPAAALADLGFEVMVAGDVGELIPLAEGIGVIVLPESDRAAWMAEKVGGDPLLSDIPLLGIRPDGVGWQGLDAEGWLPWPPDPVVTAESLLRWMTVRKARRTASVAGELMRGLADAVAQLSDRPELEDSLDAFLQTSARLFGSPAAILVLLGKGEREAWVVASHEGVGGRIMPLDEAAVSLLKDRIRTSRPEVIETAGGDALLHQALERSSELPVETSMTIPVPVLERSIGAVVLALPARPVCPMDQLLVAGRLLATMLGTALRGSPLLKRLMEQTKPVSLERVQSELRSRAMRRYQEFFESSSDGVIVVDDDARVLHINRAGAMMTGYAVEWLVGRSLSEIVSTHHHDGLDEIVASAVSEVSLRNFDLQLKTTSEDLITVDVSTGVLMLDQPMAVFTFRDVSEARAIEHELTKTKEFLERLIDSAVDAIVATDAVDGRIILFNQGAEKMFGRSEEETVGQLTLADLFPEEEYEDFIRQLHSPQFGGEGRLEQRHLHARDSMGQHVPVGLTASTIHEEGKEVALVAIITDLREQIQIRERLAMTQEKLEVTEKQALIAELAGTTAHELNQPLTSVLGYSELLLRKAGPESPYAQTIHVIMREAERMADIVRKIGKITRYETKSYVGATQILDLERSAEE